jgi:hypothetical protein
MHERRTQLPDLGSLLHPLLRFALVLAFLAASVGVAFVSPVAGGVGLVGTMAGVLIAYLTGRAPSAQPNEAQQSPH